MEEKEFRSQLMESMKLARKQGMCLSEEQIHSFFPDIQQGSEQMGFLLEYYKNQKIGVGDRKEVEEYLSMEDRNYLEEYLNGISALESMEMEELKAVMLSAIAGDQDAKEVLLQQFLPKTAELAKLYAGQGVMLEDLIGEGNMALLEATGQMECLDTDGDILEETEGFLGNYMMKAMERLINEELEKKNDDEEVLKKVNQVADAARELSEELRRKVSPEEICANYEAITMDDVEAAMQISANLIDTIEMEYKNE
jgi:DNA-directed RNA polymerase sigma subunit (sigma70/sigma32)